MGTIEANSLANSLKADAQGNDKVEIQNELGNILHTQGGIDTDHAQGDANKLVELVGTSSDTGGTYQSASQRSDSGVAVSYHTGGFVANTPPSTASVSPNPVNPDHP